MRNKQSQSQWSRCAICRAKLLQQARSMWYNSDQIKLQGATRPSGKLLSSVRGQPAHDSLCNEPRYMLGSSSPKRSSREGWFALDSHVTHNGLITMMLFLHSHIYAQIIWSIYYTVATFAVTFFHICCYNSESQDDKTKELWDISLPAAPCLFILSWLIGHRN